MDWKLLVFVFVILLGFFGYQQCSEKERPSYDRIQAQLRAEKQRSFEAQRRAQERERQAQAKEAALGARGERPEKKTAVLETEDFRAVFSTRGGSLASFTLKDPQYLEAPRNWTTGLRDDDVDEADLVPVDMVSANAAEFEEYSPLRFKIYEGIDAWLEKSDYEIVSRSPVALVFKNIQPGLLVDIYKKYQVDPDNPYQLWLTIRVTNRSNEQISFRSGVIQQGYQHVSETEGSIFSKPPNIMQGLCRYSDETFREPWTELEEPFTGVGDISFTGVETNYFLAAMIPAADTPVSCHVERIRGQGWGIMRSELRFAEATLAPGRSTVFKVQNYMGPKRFRTLQSVGHDLEHAVDFGWFWMQPICHVLLAMLLTFQSWVNNWGLAIIMLTVVIKVVLIPLTHRSFTSAERMKALKPEVDKISEKHKDDPQAKQQAIMGLYKTHKVNPLGGCLPSLLQMPIWIALYNTLRTSPELYRAEFFGWIDDLSSPDPYFVTPVLMGAMMFLQQRFTPMTGDSAQAKMMMYFMPIMFAGMMLFLPSGLTLYILVNTTLSIAHQLLIHRSRSKNASPQKGAAGGPPAKKKA